MMLFAQSKIITGTVNDEKGMPLSGVSVALNGSSVGKNTDQEGKYSIEAPAEGVLVFSYVGFANKELPVNRRTVINSQLTALSQSLDQVVVVGHGSQKKSLVTGAISSIRAKDIANISTARSSSFCSLIAPKFPGW
jgi:hypothetical protein